MGFMSFNENYYRSKLEGFESRPLTDADIYEAKQLLKVLDDLSDEGYTNLNDRMEADFSCLTRFRELIRNAGAVPFPIDHERPAATGYEDREYELEDLLGQLIENAEKHSKVSYEPFLGEIYRYCEWIGSEEDTAYIFLLRDALLPYAFFKSRGQDHVYPWLISRRFLADVTKTEDVDDDIRLPLYEALESGCVGFSEYSAFCKERILQVLDAHPELKATLLELLGSVKQERIIAIESGYMGTIPMMLKALDGRVDLRLFTTAPYLYETYRDRIFCRRYEDIRRFETVYSQDLLLRYSSYRGGRFYVNVSDDATVKDRSLAEIKRFI